MNKFELISKYKKFIKNEKIQPEKALVGAGGSMLMHGLRTSTEDIDLGVEPEVFESLRDRGFEIYTFGENIEVLVYDDFIDVHFNDGEDFVIINGVGCWTLEEVLKLKERLNRPKDQEDIKKIKDYLKKKNKDLKSW